MKKLFGGMSIISVFFLSSVYGLSCAGPAPTFQEMYTVSELAFVGTVISTSEPVAQQEDLTDSNDHTLDYNDICSSNNLVAGLYGFSFNVEEVLKGSLGSTATLTRSVTDINCQRGGACKDLVPGESYVVLTNGGKELGGGLCRRCPYMLAAEVNLEELTNSIIDFEYLTTEQEDFIELIVNEWLEKASIDEIIIVKQKITDKIAGIEDTLSFSRFEEGSEVLRSYKFTLEVLWKLDSLL